MSDLVLTAPNEDEIGLRRAPRIREEEVRQTADALLVEGGRPTVERVRARLGRGSPNTIALHLDRWWVHLGARLRDLPGQELPGVPEPVSKALVSLWSSAIDEARGMLRDSLAAQATDLEIQRHAFAERHMEFERAQAEFARERTALDQTVAIVQEQLAQANVRHQADVARSRELQYEGARLLEQHERTRAQATEYAARLDAARIAHQEVLQNLQERSEATERHWMKQIDEVRQALTRERKRTATLDRERVAEITRLSGELQNAQAERASGQGALVTAHEKLAAARAAISHLEEAVRQQQARAEDAVRQLHAQTANALTREQFEQRLREVLSKTLHENMTARRRFTPGDKSGR